jgi:uncharacterized protein YcbX
LTPESLDHATLTPGRCIPWDRAFALAQGDAAFDPSNPAWVPKTNFMCLVRNTAIAGLKTRFDETAQAFLITTPAGETISANPTTQAGQAVLTEFFTAYLGPEARYGAENRAPRFYHVADHSFCDHRTQVISLIGLGSLRALEQAVGERRDKRRFRANIYIDDIAPWAEFGWLGQTLAIGETTMIVQERIDRCMATAVNPDTAMRDANPVQELRANFGHVDLGIFAEVLTGGEIRPGDQITVI